jgi:capsid protein
VRTPSPFGANDPAAKARRLARALVSDIVTYFPERRDQALQQGTLKREFMEEIKKSWEEYVAQVGAETARSTPYFREALNDILAKGQQVF